MAPLQKKRRSLEPEGENIHDDVADFEDDLPLLEESLEPESNDKGMKTSNFLFEKFLP